MTLTHTGNLIMYDGKNATVIDTGLALPSGLAVDRVKGYLYVALTAIEVHCAGAMGPHTRVHLLKT